MVYGSVLVFGDIGRSPRMQNHALEIVKQTSYKVHLIGYLENKPHQKLLQNENINIIPISTSIIDKLKKLPKIFYLFYAISRILIQIFQLFYIFFIKLRKQELKPDFVIVQNPPSIPVLFVIYITSKLKNIKFIVDFHNYGYTILQLNIKNKVILKIATFYEQFFGSKCDFSFCVSKNMRKNLQEQWKVKDPLVLYDKAQKDIFKELNLQQKHSDIYEKLFKNQENSENPFTFFNKESNQIQYKKDRPFLLVSSTSWTKDEDFSILLNAMVKYEEEAKLQKQKKYPQLKLVITGKGPEKEFYLNLINKQKQNWKFIDIQTMWLEAEDYPKLLASADLGICLHYSSSGYDLPMKVVDMFGAGLPVLAINYISINELVVNNENGFIFEDGNSLFKLLNNIFTNWESQYQEVLEVKFKNNIKKFRNQDFQKEWSDVVKPVLLKIQKENDSKKRK